MRILLVGLMTALLALPAYAQSTRGGDRTLSEPRQPKAAKKKAAKKPAISKPAPERAPMYELYDTEKAMR